jgi:hypothetical protein
VICPEKFLGQIKNLSALSGNETEEYSCRAEFFFDRYLPIEEKISLSVSSVPGEPDFERDDS